MSYTEEDDMFTGLGDGCPLHGDEAMRECSLCGAEFCTRCQPRSTVCPECAAAPEEESSDEADEIVSAPVLEDHETDQLLREADFVPADDLFNDETRAEDEVPTTSPPEAPPPGARPVAPSKRPQAGKRPSRPKKTKTSASRATAKPAAGREKKTGPTPAEKSGRRGPRRRR